MSPLFFGTWENPVGEGVRFINTTFSNIDMLQWVKQLGVKYFRGIYSRDNLPQKIHKLETGIINLDDSMGGGSHWICYRNVDKQYCEYFDPFGLIMPNEIKHLKTSDKKWCTHQMKYKKETVCFVVIGAQSPNSRLAIKLG